MCRRSCGGRSGQLVTVVTVAAQIVLLQLVAGTAAAQFVTWDKLPARSTKRRDVSRLVKEKHVNAALAGKTVRLSGKGRDGLGSKVEVREALRLVNGQLHYIRNETTRGTNRTKVKWTRARVSRDGALDVNVERLTKPQGEKGFYKRDRAGQRSDLFKELDVLLGSPVREKAAR